jgi:hypothetical protein
MNTLVNRWAASFHGKAVAWVFVLMVCNSQTAELSAQVRADSSPGHRESARANLKSPWERILVIGASASSGFTVSEPLGGPNTKRHSLSTYLDAAVSVPHEPVQNLASSMFFLRPGTFGSQQIERALQARPTLVVAVDFLFWFCYGELPDENARMDRFESGLKMLESLNCPLVIGDIPDASGAINGMLRPQQVPTVETISAVNRRLKTWAAKHPGVVVVSLSNFMGASVANQAINIRGHTVPEGKTRGLLQEDKLHPTPLGAAVLSAAILDAFQATRPPHSADEIRWNPEEIFRLAADPSLRKDAGTQ